MSAEARLIGAQRDGVIASYTPLSAVGRLDVMTLGLNPPDYLPSAITRCATPGRACARARRPGRSFGRAAREE